MTPKRKIMKFKLLVLFTIFSTFSYAQKAKVTSAYNYNNYGELDKAQEAIDQAIADPSTAGFWKAWMFRGDIYVSIARTQDENFKKLSPDPVKVAYESYKKVYSLDDSKKLDMNELNQKYRSMYPMAFNVGIEAYNEKNYDRARQYFMVCEDVNKHFGITDTLSMYNVALTSDLLNDVSTAEAYYQKCIDAGYKGDNTYVELVNLYLKNEMEEKAKETLKKARKDYPDSQPIITTELNIYLANEQYDEALKNLDAAIKNDPSNDIFYYARGTIYNNKGENEKAEADYLKAVELNNDNFDAFYNLGALYYNNGADAINACNEIKDNNEYKKCKDKANLIFEKAVPYLERAYELNPEDQNTLNSLKQTYVRTGQTEKYNALKK